MSEPRLKVRNLFVRYNNFVAVSSIDFELGDSSLVLFGPSGCGKTSILKAILGVNEPGMRVTGQILLDDKEVKKASGEIGMTIQGPIIPPWIRVFDLCKMGSNMRNLEKSDQKAEIMSMLEYFNIAHLANSFPQNLSGGEKQRAALAITLLNKPKVLLLDEPTTFIDGITRSAIWDYFEEKIYPMKIPTIIVSHDPMEAMRLGDEIFILQKGAIVKEKINVPFEHPRSEDLYQKQLFWDMKHNFLNNINKK